MLVPAMAWAGASSGSPVAPAELKKALAKYQNIKTLDVDFRQIKIIKDMKAGRLESSGHLRLERPGRVVWKITKPEVMSVVLDEKKIVITNRDGESETFNSSEAGSGRDQRNLEDMLHWLKLDADSIAAAYEVTRLDSSTLMFEAKRPDSAMKKLQMAITAKGDVRELKFYEASGDEMTLTFGVPKIVREKP